MWIVRECFFVNSIQNLWNKISFSKIWDFQIWDYIFEVWWRNKDFKQIKNIEKSYLIQDDIIVWSKWVIPLYLFGVL